MRIDGLLRALPTPIKQVVKERVHPRPMPEGEVAPEWHLQAHDRSWHRQGVYWSVMQFLPYELHHEEVQQALDELVTHHDALREMGARVYAIFPAEEPELQALARERDLSFPLLTDRGASVSREFKAAIQFPLRPMVIPTLYVVNPKRRIRLSNRGAPSLEAVVRSIRALQQTTREKM